MIPIITTVNPKGQVTIPEELRDRYGFPPGTKVVWLERDGDLIPKPLLSVEQLRGRFRGPERSSRSATSTKPGMFRVYEDTMVIAGPRKADSALDLRRMSVWSSGNATAAFANRARLENNANTGAGSSVLISATSTSAGLAVGSTLAGWAGCTPLPNISETGDFYGGTLKRYVPPRGAV